MAFRTPKPVYDAETVEAIEEYLDLDSYTRTADSILDTATGLTYTEAVGNEPYYLPDGTQAPGTRAGSNYSRPMFQILYNESFSALPLAVTPCQCDRFDQSWNCPWHPEIPWDEKRHRWVRPCTGNRQTCGCVACTARRLNSAERSSGPCSCPLCTEMRQRVPDPPVHNPPVETSGGDRLRDRLMALSDVSITLTGEWTGSYTLEVDCETEQGAGPLAIEVAPATEPYDPWEPSNDTP